MQIIFKVLNSTDFFVAIIDQITALAELFMEYIGSLSNLFGSADKTAEN